MQTAIEIYRPEDQLDAYVPATANDAQVLAMWLHGKSQKTRTEYRSLATTIVFYVHKTKRFKVDISSSKITYRKNIDILQKWKYFGTSFIALRFAGRVR